MIFLKQYQENETFSWLEIILKFHWLLTKYSDIFFMSATPPPSLFLKNNKKMLNVVERQRTSSLAMIFRSATLPENRGPKKPCLA